MPSSGPMAVSAGLLVDRDEIGARGIEVPMLVTVAPPPAVTVTSNENVEVPGGIVTPLQVTVVAVERARRGRSCRRTSCPPARRR